MSKNDFLNELRERLEISMGPQVQELIAFYDEAISDRIDAGMAEEEAVAQVGSIDEIVKNVKLDLPMATVVTTKIKESHEKAKKSGMGWLWILLAIIGSPVWVPLLIGILGVLFGVYVTLWAVVFTLFVVLVTLVFTGIMCLLGAIGAAVGGLANIPALALFGAGVFLIGFSILMWSPCVWCAKGLAKVISLGFKGIKKLFV